MSIRNRLMAIAAATALTAATAVPAMALENEFHGAFGVRAMTSNYLVGGGTGYLFAASGAGDSATTNNFVEQRARIFYTAKANDNLKLVTAFELDSTWGKSSYTVGRANEGGALGADTINLETKWTYLDFNIPSSLVNMKVGLQGLNDSYKNVFVGQGADAAGALLSAPIGPVALTAGFFRLDDRSVTAATLANGVNNGYIVNGSGNTANVAFTNGKKTRDLYLLDAKFAPTKAVKVGASYYFLNSDNAVALSTGGGDYNVHVIGANAAATFGPATVDGFALYQFGVSGTTHVSAFAANATGKMKVGPGTAKINALYVSGGSNAFQNVNNETSAAFSENALGGAFGNMFLLVRNSGNTTNDAYVVYDSANRGMGIIGGSVGYDTAITPKAFANVNAGFLAVAKDQGPTHNSKYQGTEVNAELGYKLYDNMTASLQGAYVMLGDFYKGLGRNATNPADPYMGRVVLNYVF